MRLRRTAQVGALMVACAFGPAFGQVPDPLSSVRRLVEAGAFELALARIDEQQPRDADEPRWPDWEVTRIETLARSGRDKEALARAASLVRRDAPQGLRRDLARAAVPAALRLGDGALARSLLAPLLWAVKPEPAEFRAQRLAVIESYAAERGGIEEAYRAMLRFQQDFLPLERGEAARFVGILIEADRAQDAVLWLPQLDPASALAARLRVRTGLLAPGAAVAQARALAAKTTDPVGAWALMLDAARLQRSRLLEVEAREQRLGLPDPSAAGGGAAADAGALWQAYTEAAKEIANDAQLLSGDDAAFADRASRLLASQPHAGRALFAHLATAAREPATRRTAQMQLATSLIDARLGATLLRLFADLQRNPPASLDPHLRLRLGELASSERRPALAVAMWSGLDAPAGESGESWQARLAVELLRAGRTDEGIQSLRALAGKRTLPAPAIARLVAAAGESLDALRVPAALELHGLLLAYTDGRTRVDLLAGLGRARELAGDHRGAGAALLEAALALPEADPLAVRLRESAAINLARAGLREDARAQYQWIARNARDPALRESAGRALRAP